MLYCPQERKSKEGKASCGARKNLCNGMLYGMSGFLYSLGDGNYLLDSEAFLIGMAYGLWDYKSNEDWQVPYASFDGNDMNIDNNKNWRAWMYYDGMLVAGDDFGNMNLAYVGQKMNLPTIFYQNAVTTDGKDRFWIQYGIDLAVSGR